MECDGTIYVSGQLPIDPASGNFADGDIKVQARQSLTNIKNILAAAGKEKKFLIPFLNRRNECLHFHHSLPLSFP